MSPLEVQEMSVKVSTCHLFLCPCLGVKTACPLFRGRWILSWPMAKLLTFWDDIFSRENNPFKVQTFISGFHSLPLTEDS